MPIDEHFDSSLVEKRVQHGTERKITKGDRRMYIFCAIAWTDC